MSESNISAPSALPFPTRLNLGCGYDVRDGYLNVDLYERHNPDIVADVTDLSTLPGDYFDEIIAQDVLEHLERHKTVPALLGWARLLKPGGVIHIRVPSLYDLFELLCSPQWRESERVEEVIHLMFGTQAYTGDYHLTAFTPRILVDYLSRAGLTLCKAQLTHGWLYDVSARKTDRLTDPLEIAHNLYFKVLDRAGDAGGLGHIAAEIAAGRLDQSAAEHLLQESDEARFIAANPVYLRKHRAPPEPAASMQAVLAERERERELELVRAALKAAEAERDALLTSTTWRMTAPLRNVIGKIKAALPR